MSPGGHGLPHAPCVLSRCIPGAALRTRCGAALTAIASLTTEEGTLWWLTLTHLSLWWLAGRPPPKSQRTVQFQSKPHNSCHTPFGQALVPVIFLELGPFLHHTFLHIFLRGDSLFESPASLLSFSESLRSSAARTAPEAMRPAVPKHSHATSPQPVQCPVVSLRQTQRLPLPGLF